MLIRKSHPAWISRANHEHEAALMAFHEAAEELERRWSAVTSGDYEARRAFGPPIPDQPGRATYALGFPDHGIGACLVALGRREDARDHLSRARDGYEQALKKHRSDDDLLFYLAGVRSLLGDERGALLALGRYKRAARNLRDPMRYVRGDLDFAAIAGHAELRALVDQA